MGGGGSRSRHDTATPQSVKYHIYYDIFQGSQVNTGYGRDGGGNKNKNNNKKSNLDPDPDHGFRKGFVLCNGGGGREGGEGEKMGLGLGDWGIGNWD